MVCPNENQDGLKIVMIFVFAQALLKSVSFDALLPQVSTIVIFGAIMIIVGVTGYFFALKLKQQAASDAREDLSHSFLTEVRNAYHEGELSREEYQKIRARLSASIRDSSDPSSGAPVEMREFSECDPPEAGEGEEAECSQTAISGHNR